jgi:hypothetical protein
MISLRKEDVPQYLNASSFYASLADDADEWFDVPAGTLKADTNVTTIQELRELLSTLRFWGATCELPTHVIAFILDCDFAEVEALIAEFSQEFPLLAGLQKIRVCRNLAEKLIEAAKLEHICVLDYFRDAISAPEASTLDLISIAAKYGHLPCVEYLVRCRTTPVTLEACKAAAGAGHLELLKYLFHQGFPWDKDTCLAAAGNGHLSCLQFAHEQACPWDQFVCREAALQGQLECLRFLFQQGCPHNHNVMCSLAAQGGNVLVLQYVIEYGCTLDAHVCYTAAYYGNLACLQCAREYGCPWDSGTCEAAACSGQLECLRYALVHGCPLSRSLCTRAGRTGHLECLILARAHSAFWEQTTCVEIALGGHVDCFQYAATHGCPMHYDKCTITAARYGRVSILRFIYKQTGELVIGTCMEAASQGQLECLQYAHKQGSPMTAECARLAYRGKHFHCLKYIIEHGAFLADQVSNEYYFEHCAPPTSYEGVRQRLRWLLACVLHREITVPLIVILAYVLLVCYLRSEIEPGWAYFLGKLLSED